MGRLGHEEDGTLKIVKLEATTEPNWQCKFSKRKGRQLYIIVEGKKLENHILRRLLEHRIICWHILIYANQPKSLPQSPIFHHVDEVALRMKVAVYLLKRHCHLNSRILHKVLPRVSSGIPSVLFMEFLQSASKTPPGILPGVSSEIP